MSGISKFPIDGWEGSNFSGSGFNVNDFYKLHIGLKSIEEQVNRDENDPNVSNNAWLQAKENLCSLKCKYDALMQANQKEASRPLIDRVSNDTERVSNNSIQQTEEKQLSGLKQNKDPKIDFGFLERYLEIASKVNFIIGSRKMNKPLTLTFNETAAILLKWYPEFRYDWEFLTSLIDHIDVWHLLQKEKCFDHKEIPFEELICASYTTQKLSELFNQKGFNYISNYRYLVDNLNFVTHVLNSKLARQMDAYGETNFTPFVKEQLELLKSEAKRLYWSNASNDSPGEMILDIEKYLSHLNACVHLLQNEGSDVNSKDALRTEIFKIGHKMHLTVKWTLPYLLQEQMRLKSEETQQLKDSSPEIQELQTLMRDLNADTFEDLIRNFYMRYGFFGTHGTSYLESGSVKSIESPPLKTITFLNGGEQEAQKISLEMRSFCKARAAFDTQVDPRLSHKSSRIRAKAKRGVLTIDHIQASQLFLASYIDRDLSEATRGAAIQLSYDTNMHFLQLLAKKPLISKSGLEVKSIENLILDSDESFVGENQLHLCLVQEMVVAYFLTQICCPIADELNRSFPYLPPSGERIPLLSALSGMSTTENFPLTQHVYEQMSYAYNLSFKKDEDGPLDPFFKNPLGILALDPKQGMHAVDHLHRLDTQTFTCSELQDSLATYLNEVRKMQVKGKLGNIGFHISVSGQGVQRHLAMNLQISEGPLAEINLINPNSHDEHLVTCGRTEQVSDWLLKLVQRLDGASTLRVSLTPFCSKKLYQNNLKDQEFNIAGPSNENNTNPHTEVIKFPCALYGKNIVAVRGDVPGILNWNDNHALTVRDGHFVFEIPQGHYARQEYKFVLLVPGKEPIWEKLKDGGNRKLSANHSEFPVFSV